MFQINMFIFGCVVSPRDALAVRVVSSVDMGGCEERAQPLAVDGTCSLFFPVSNFSWRLWYHS